MLKALEKKLRTLRDEKIIKPLLASNAFRKHSPVHGDVAVFDIGDHLIATDPYDGFAHWIRDKRGWFREETMRIFNAMPRKGGVFVDVGANLGTQTIYALKFGGFERAICIEPHPRNAQLLRINLALNGLSDRAEVIEAAAGAEAGTASMSISRGSGTHSLAYQAGERSMMVPVVRVEDELRRLGIRDIGLAWIDVEGFEGEVLKGWPSLVGSQLCIEYTPNVRLLPEDAFSGWDQWADGREDTIRWRPIETLDIPSYAEQVDLLLR